MLLVWPGFLGLNGLKFFFCWFFCLNFKLFFQFKNSLKSTTFMNCYKMFFLIPAIEILKSAIFKPLTLSLKIPNFIQSLQTFVYVLKQVFNGDYRSNDWKPFLKLAFFNFNTLSKEHFIAKNPVIVAVLTPWVSKWNTTYVLVAMQLIPY